MNNRLYRLVRKFRDALDRLKKAGELDDVICFRRFPHGSCGDTCYLLAEYLLENGIYTEYVCGTKDEQSHAWLVVTDKEMFEENRIKNKHKELVCKKGDDLNDYEKMLRLIQTASISDVEYVAPDYDSELQGRIIIDITGDQFCEEREFLFYDIPVYVGMMDEMHRLFEINFIHICTGLEGVGGTNQYRLCSLYRKIKELI